MAMRGGAGENITRTHIIWWYTYNNNKFLSENVVNATRLISKLFWQFTSEIFELLFSKSKANFAFVSNAGRDFTTFDSLTHCCIKTPRKETAVAVVVVVFSFNVASKFYVSRRDEIAETAFSRDGDRKTNVTPPPTTTTQRGRLYFPPMGVTSSLWAGEGTKSDLGIFGPHPRNRDLFLWSPSQCIAPSCSWWCRWSACEQSVYQSEWSWREEEHKICGCKSPANEPRTTTVTASIRVRHVNFPLLN